MAVHFINPKHTERFREAINSDPEFKLSARQLTEDALLEVGDSQCIVKIRDGVITQIKVEPTNLNRWGFAIRAPIESWEKLLQPVPPPYYDSLWGGMIRGTFRLEGDLPFAFAYFLAITRMLDVMRQVQNKIVNERKRK
jgi:hypothetical protein